MRMPWQKRTTEPRPGPSEAAQAVERADRSLREVKEQGKEVSREAGKLKRIQAENNFARTIERALRGTAP